MDLNNLEKLKGNKKPKKRLGRGYGSTKGGHTSTRGQKGQKSRGSSKVAAGFEGGQVPLYKKLPQIGGFKSHKNSALAINIDLVSSYKEGETITPEVLLKDKKIKTIPKEGVKILSGGKLDNKLTFEGFTYSAKAKEKIEKSGSKINA